MLKISVLTPSYNSGKYLDRAINSVLSQGYAHFEHIIVDGGSNDGTLDILKKYDHLQWVSEPDKGQSDAMNKAFKVSTGDIIVYLNADDEFAAAAFAEIIKTFTQFPEADIVVGNLVVADQHKSTTKFPSASYSDLILYWHAKHPYNPVSYFYRRKVQIAIGIFPLDNHYAMDIWFLLKAYQKFKVIKINATLGTFHSDGDNKTANTNVGQNLHNAVKSHLKKNDPLKLPYFYFKLLQAKLSK
jgi:glycosyltransferase involved in cell wall biosynthesis